MSLSDQTYERGESGGVGREIEMKRMGVKGLHGEGGKRKLRICKKEGNKEKAR